MREVDPGAAREAVLARIRGALGPRAARAVPATLARPRTSSTRAERVERFRSELEAVGGHVRVVADLAAARAALAELAATLELRTLALSDHPLVRACCASLAGVETFDGWDDRQRLFACDAGLSSAQQAVAETGTLVLESSAERHRLVSLVPPIHLAVVPARSIVDGLDQALAAVRNGGEERPPRCVSLITGPSRTGDIEMKLVVGVHGPRELHVIVIEEVPE